MNHQNRSHSERSVAAGEGGGDTESKNPVRSQKLFGHYLTSLRHSTGLFTPRLVPRRSVQNDRVWERFIGSPHPENLARIVTMNRSMVALIFNNLHTRFMESGAKAARWA